MGQTLFGETILPFRLGWDPFALFVGDCWPTLGEPVAAATEGLFDRLLAVEVTESASEPRR